MKATLFDTHGKKKGNLELPKVFSTKIREDIIQKYFEANKFIQPYSSDPKGGKKHSASGTISHKRHDWKAHYGRGISRLPRKTMWRRGTNFFWIGAEVSGTRGGRRAHPPKGIGKEKKVNKKEIKLAMNSAIAATAKADLIINRYDRVENLDITPPVIIESVPSKTKDAKTMFKAIYGRANDLIWKEKSVRAGKGKLRNRKYKSTAGLLLIHGKDEFVKMKGIDSRTPDTVSIADLYPLGRLTAYTEKAIKELEK